MLKLIIKRILKKIGWRLIKILPPPKSIQEDIQKEIIDAILHSNGVLHIGAHRGSEAPIYSWFDKPAIWIEANNEIFEELKINLHHYEDQFAYNYLILDKNEDDRNFYISNNDGASSSVFEFGEDHQNTDLFNNRRFDFIKTKKIKSHSLDSFLKLEKISINKYNYWVIDVQGAELLVLNGCKTNLQFCKYLYIEISKKSFYKNGAKWQDLKKFLDMNNFIKITDPKYDHDNVLFKNLDFKSTQEVG